MTTDRDKLKIASFRTTDRVWADFTSAANKIGLTATDVIKAAMEQFIAGEYVPSINTGTYTAVNTQSGITRDEIQQLIDTAVSTAISTANSDVSTDINTCVSMSALEANIMTVISTMSLPTIEDVSTAIGTALAPLREEISEVSEFARNLQGEIAAITAKPTKPPSPKPASSAIKPEGAMSITELSEKLGISRQGIESRRKAGTLEGSGFRAERVEKSWFYFPV
jgi:hypothetical protein